jgi:hypothetical protein
MEPGPHDFDGADGAALPMPEVGGDEVIAATAGLEVIARDRLSMASNDLAGIVTGAHPAVQGRLLDVIADLDDLATELRHIIVVLRNGSG